MKTSWRHFRKTYCKYVLKTSWRRLQEVLEDEKCYAEDVFKTSWRRLGKQECWAGISPFLQFVSIVFNYFRCWLWKIKCQLGYLKSIRNLLSFSSIVKNIYFSPHWHSCAYLPGVIFPLESPSLLHGVSTLVFGSLFLSFDIWSIYINTLLLKKYNSQKMKFPMKDFFSKCDQIHSFLGIRSHLLKKSLMGNFIFCLVV